MSGVGVDDVVQCVVNVLFLATLASKLAKAVKHCKGTRSNAPKNSVDQGDAKQKEVLATVILALFTGEMKTYGHAEASTYGWSANLVHLKKAEIPENIDRSVKSSALERTVRRIVGLKAKKGIWTVEELRAGLMAAYVPDKNGECMPRTRAAEAHGLTRETLYDYYKQHLEMFDKSTWAAQIKILQKANTGRKPYLDDNEVKFLLLKACAEKQQGDGVSVKRFCGYVREMLQAHAEAAEAIGDFVTARRYKSVKCSKTWAHEMLDKYADELGMSRRGRKTSKLSHNRASTNSEFLTHEMMEKIRKLYDDVLGPGMEPDASQVFNGDEVGFDPSGTWARVLSLKGDRVNAMVGTGEKAPFWATLFFISRADGQVVVPPTVVHQGVTGQNKQSSMIIGTGRHDRNGVLQTQYLPQGWNVHQTPSGYMDKLGFRHAMDYFISYCGLP